MKKEITFCDICGKETDQSYGNVILKVSGQKSVTGHITDVCRKCADKLEGFIKGLMKEGEKVDGDG